MLLHAAPSTRSAGLPRAAFGGAGAVEIRTIMTPPLTSTSPLDAWSRLHDGPMLSKADERARSANEHRPESIPAVVDDAASAEVLPPLGYRLEPTVYPAWTAGPRRPHTWKRSYTFSAFLLRLQTQLAARITSEGRDDGTVRQSLSTEQAVEAWRAQRAAYFSATSTKGSPALQPDECDLPAHLAFAMQQIPGDGWSVTPRGLERILAPWPLRYAPTLQPLKLELKTGLLADCIGWAYLPAASQDNDGPVHELVYLSGVGPQKKLKAAWATLMDKKRDMIKVPSAVNAVRFDMINTRRIEGTKVYDTFWNDEPLPESGMAHLVIQHRSLLAPRTNQPFLHLVGADGTPHLSLFAWQLDRASTLPIKPAWAEQLWQGGIDAGAILRLPSYGCQAYWVRPNEDTWSELVARCAGATGSVSIETFGIAVDTTPAIAMVVGESDDEPLPPASRTSDPL
jgi:hypothetical protein